MKIRPVGEELFHADGHTGRWTDSRTAGRTESQRYMTKLIVDFPQYCELA
jgi:hypothetical protein